MGERESHFHFNQELLPWLLTRVTSNAINLISHSKTEAPRIIEDTHLESLFFSINIFSFQYNFIVTSPTCSRPPNSTTQDRSVGCLWIWNHVKKWSCKCACKTKLLIAFPKPFLCIWEGMELISYKHTLQMLWQNDFIIIYLLFSIICLWLEDVHWK